MLAHIEALLAGGLATEWQTRAYTSDEVQAVTVRLQALDAGDVTGRLVVAGFTLTPHVPPGDADGLQQCCATCMYFERHRRWCNLSELMLPVKAAWSCVLWRI